MSIAELLPALRELNRAEKLRVMHFLVQQLAEEEAWMQAGQSYAVWSPYEAHDAAQTLMGVLERERSTNAGQ